MVSKGLGLKGERGGDGGGGQLSLIEFFAGSRTMFHLLPIRGNHWDTKEPYRGSG